MAEFCMECLNKISDTNFKEKDFVMSKGLDYCEECCQLKHIVIKRKTSSDFFSRIFSAIK